MLTKKSRFFGARSASELVFIGAKGALRKILVSVGQKWISEKVSKGGPFGSAGGRIPEGGGGGASAPGADSTLPVFVFKSETDNFNGSHVVLSEFCFRYSKLARKTHPSAVDLSQFTIMLPARSCSSKIDYFKSCFHIELILKRE